MSEPIGNSEQLTREKRLAEIRANRFDSDCEFLLAEIHRQHDEFYNEVRIRDQEIENLRRQLNPPLTTGLKPLRGTQSRVYDYLATYIKKHSYSPSQREIAEAVGLVSSSTVNGHLERLEKAGYIDRNGGKPRAIRITGARQ